MTGIRAASPARPLAAISGGVAKYTADVLDGVTIMHVASCRYVQTASLKLRLFPDIESALEWAKTIGYRVHSCGFCEPLTQPEEGGDTSRPTGVAVPTDPVTQAATPRETITVSTDTLAEMEKAAAARAAPRGLTAANAEVGCVKKKFINHPWVVALVAGGFWWGLEDLVRREALPDLVARLASVWERVWEVLVAAALVFLLMSLARRTAAVPPPPRPKDGNLDLRAFIGFVLRLLGWMLLIPMLLASVLMLLAVVTQGPP